MTTSFLPGRMHSKLEIGREPTMQFVVALATTFQAAIDFLTVQVGLSVVSPLQLLLSTSMAQNTSA